MAKAYFRLVIEGEQHNLIVEPTNEGCVQLTMIDDADSSYNAGPIEVAIADLKYWLKLLEQTLNNKG